MTQSYNLSQLANNLNTAGQLDATDGLVGAVPAANGGTGQASYTVGDVLYASGATALSKLADVATGNALISGGVGIAPSYGKIGLTTHVSGTLGLANGGTNSTATPAAGSVIFGTGSAMSSTAAGTSGQVLTSAGTGTPTWQSPVSLGVGQTWQSVTRVAGTTYTNSTGKPIFLSAVLSNSVNTADITLTISSIAVASISLTQTSSGAFIGTVQGIIPDSATYVISVSGAGVTLVTAKELR